VTERDSNSREAVLRSEEEREEDQVRLGGARGGWGVGACRGSLPTLHTAHCLHRPTTRPDHNTTTERGKVRQGEMNGQGRHQHKPMPCIDDESLVQDAARMGATLTCDRRDRERGKRKRQAEARQGEREERTGAE
jgi:hypothetical protein